MAFSEDELRADLQQYYGVDLDGAIAGKHSTLHIAALVTQLPLDSRLCKKANKENAWDLHGVLLALLVNDLRSFIYGMSDKRKRGNAPEPIGPSWLIGSKGKSLPSRVLPINQLMNELNKPRSANNGE